MTLQRVEIGSVPEETVRIAKASFPHGNRYMRLRDMLGTIFDDSEFADLFSRRGKPAETPWRLGLVCLIQYLEDLTDRQAADAVRARVDVKYLLGLEIGDPGFDFTVLTEFRTRLIEHQAEHRLFDLLVAKLNEQGYLKKRGIQRTDSTHVLAAVIVTIGLSCFQRRYGPLSTNWQLRTHNGCTSGCPETGSSDRSRVSMNGDELFPKKSKRHFWSRSGEMGLNCSRRSIKKQPRLSSLACLTSNCCGRFGCSIISGRTSNCVCARKTCFLLLILRFVRPMTHRLISEAKETSHALVTKSILRRPVILAFPI